MVSRHRHREERENARVEVSCVGLAELVCGSSLLRMIVSRGVGVCVCACCFAAFLAPNPSLHILVLPRCVEIWTSIRPLFAAFFGLPNQQSDVSGKYVRIAPPPPQLLLLLPLAWAHV